WQSAQKEMYNSPCRQLLPPCLWLSEYIPDSPGFPETCVWYPVTPDTGSSALLPQEEPVRFPVPCFLSFSSNLYKLVRICLPYILLCSCFSYIQVYLISRKRQVSSS